MLKELSQRGHEVIGFEKSSSAGGVYVKCYEDALLTTSSIQTAFSCHSDGKEGTPVFWPTSQYAAYLQSYAQRFGVLQRIQFNTSVTSVAPEVVDGVRKWRVTVASSDGKPVSHVVDHVAICCGAHNLFSRTPFPGEEGFAGVVVHSSQYKRAGDHAGQRVVVVGLGESGSDVCLQIARVASSSCFSTRSGPGYVIPRYYAGRVSDLDTTRAYHALPRWLGGTCFSRLKHMLEVSVITDEFERRMWQEVAAVNKKRGLPWQRRFGTKNTGFIEAKLKHGMIEKPDIHHIEGPSTVVFTDGSRFEADAIICCTGFVTRFPFLEAWDAQLATSVRNVRNLYKHGYHPDLGAEIVWAGFTRPGVGSIPPISELAARYFALVVSGERQLPCKHVMVEVIEADKQRELEQYVVDGARLLGLTDYLTLLTDFARLIGCEPPLWKLFFTQPSLWWRVLLGPMNSAQYRLAGPDADPAAAEAVLRRLPMMPYRVLLVELLALSACKALSILGFSQFDTVGV